MKNNNEYIYVVLVKAMTGLGKLARLFGGYEYTHIAICLEDELKDFITFSRKQHYAPFDCGFMHETLDCYAFGDNDRVKLKIFKIPVCSKNKRKIEAYIKKLEMDEEYIFNLYSMITMPILHGVKIYKADNCMSFVAKIIYLSGQVPMSKKYYHYDIKELDKLLSDYFWKEEYFKKQKNENRTYMDRVGLVRNLYLFIKLNGELLSRLIVKRK